MIKNGTAVACMLLLGNCSLVTSKDRWVVRKSWKSSFITVNLMDSVASDGHSTGQFYRIRDKERGTLYQVRSFLDASEVQDSFSKNAELFGRSDVRFSPSGRTVVIDDDSPGSASSDGHQFIIATFVTEAKVGNLRGPERQGVLMEEWPEVSAVSDASVWFQYEAKEAAFSLPLADLYRDAEIVHPVRAIKALPSRGGEAGKEL